MGIITICDAMFDFNDKLNKRTCLGIIVFEDYVMFNFSGHSNEKLGSEEQIVGSRISR